MLAMVLRLLGVDLEQGVSRLKAHVSEVAERASDRVQAQVKQTSLTLGLGFIGAVGGRIHGRRCFGSTLYLG
jgi:hypothetical protein